VATQLDRNLTEPSVEQMEALARAAWQARENAFTFGHTKVGAAALSVDAEIFVGCNVEHRFRSHDVHAEVNAITSMVTSGRTQLSAIVIAAERERFTPCGSCMDWIYQFGGPSCRVGYQSVPDGKIIVLSAEELMPYYPM
jgi:cytidine deaminase